MIRSAFKALLRLVGRADDANQMSEPNESDASSANRATTRAEWIAQRRAARRLANPDVPRDGSEIQRAPADAIQRRLARPRDERALESLRSKSVDLWPEAEALIEALPSDETRWTGLWRLILRGPPSWSAQALEVLRESAWQPEPGDRDFYGEVVALAREWRLHGANWDWGEPIQLEQRPSKETPGTHNSGVPPQSSPVQLSPDGKLVVTGHKDASILLWDLPGGTLAERQIRDRRRSTGAQTPKSVGTEVSDLLISPDGNQLISSHRDGSAEFVGHSRRGTTAHPGKSGACDETSVRDAE
jgi:hypothetical protein